MRNNATQSARPAEPELETAAAVHVDLEDCRSRLQSVELLAASSRRDALLLARALLADVGALLTASDAGETVVSGVHAIARAVPQGITRESLAKARLAVEASPPDGISDEAIAALRALVGDLVRTSRGVSPARWRTALASALQGRRRKWIAAGVVALLALGAAFALSTDNSGPARAEAFKRELGIAKSEQAAGRHAVAVDHFRRALESGGADGTRLAGVWNDMSWSLQQLGRKEEAIAGYQKALAIRPGYALPRNNLRALQGKPKP